MKTDYAIEQFLKTSIQEGIFASAVYLIAEKNIIYALGACGDAVVVPESIPANRETIYDLASLTKPLVTALLLAQMLDQEQFSLTTPVSHFLPEFNTVDKAQITIAQLATHCSGLPAWSPLYALAAAPAEVIKVIAQQPLAYSPGKEVIYSDLGYIILGFLLAQLGGNDLAMLAQEKIFQPLNLIYTCFTPPIDWRKQIAASEMGDVYAKKMTEELAINYPHWRKEVIWGSAHDLNAYFLNGVAGHAGLFSTAKEVYKLAQQFLPESCMFTKSTTLALFQKNFTPHCNEARSLGWQLACQGKTTAGKALSISSFGHLGFTGTSLWIDPILQRIYILLTNRTHPVYKEISMNECRRQFHHLAQAVFEYQL